MLVFSVQQFKLCCSNLEDMRIYNDLLYCMIENQDHGSFSSLYSFCSETCCLRAGAYIFCSFYITVNTEAVKRGYSQISRTSMAGTPLGL